MASLRKYHLTNGIGIPLEICEPISKFKASKAITPNFLAKVAHLTPDQFKLALYLIQKSEITNLINIDTNLIRSYNHYNRVLGAKSPLAKSYGLIRSYNKAKEIIISLVERQIIIKIDNSTSKYLVNPSLTFPKAFKGLSHKAKAFNLRYIELKAKGQLTEEILMEMAADYLKVVEARLIKERERQKKYLHRAA